MRPGAGRVARRRWARAAGGTGRPGANGLSPPQRLSAWKRPAGSASPAARHPLRPPLQLRGSSLSPCSAPRGGGRLPRSDSVVHGCLSRPRYSALPSPVPVRPSGRARSRRRRCVGRGAQIGRPLLPSPGRGPGLPASGPPPPRRACAGAPWLAAAGGRRGGPAARAPGSLVVAGAAARSALPLWDVAVLSATSVGHRGTRPEQADLCRMLGRLDEGAIVLSNLLLCAVCLSSAPQTFQIHRGAGVGFLLQALGPLMETAAPFTAPFGFDLDSRSADSTWVSTVVGLPLLAFAFHWLNGDHSTANILLGGALLLTAGSDYFSEEGMAVVAHSVAVVASITILIVSIFTGNSYGIAGSLLAGTAGLLAGTSLQQSLILRKRAAVQCLMAGANLTWLWALQVQHRDLDLGL